MLSCASAHEKGEDEKKNQLNNKLGITKVTVVLFFSF